MAEQVVDAVVVGSGFGGSMAAHVLVEAGWRVVLLERGDWVARGDHNWAPEGVGPLTEHHSPELGLFHCVGGPSVFYGGVSLRFREADFTPDAEIAGDSGAAWPFGYRELEPYYVEAERLLGIAGSTGGDPTDPPRSAPYPQESGELAPVSTRLEAAARGLGLSPFRLPLAIDRKRCLSCGTCDGYACAISAKNDLATTIIRPLLSRGLTLETRALATRLEVEGDRVTGVEWVHRDTGERRVHRARHVFVAAGAIMTPRLLLASGLQRLNPGGDVVGRYLMRHYNEILMGVFPGRPNPEGRFHKQLGIHDFYFGDAASGVRGKLGGLQQLTTPPVGLVRAQFPWRLGVLAAPWVEYLTGWLTIAEDQPRYQNRVRLEGIDHRHTDRDRAAGLALCRRARAILRRAGALFSVRHRVNTFSHAVGTVRMGTDPRTSALDGDSRFRGLQNLHVVDGSVMPSSAAVNPSLTIAALSLRAARRLVARTREASDIRSHAAVQG
jgi:choline dehydrogenase-like flavoprotein